MIKDTDQTDVHRSEPNSCKKWKDGHSRDGCPLRHQRHLSRHRGAKFAMDDVASTHLKPVNPSVIFIKLAKSRLMAPKTLPFADLIRLNPSLALDHKVPFVSRSPQLKALRYCHDQLTGPAKQEKPTKPDQRTTPPVHQT